MPIGMRLTMRVDRLSMPPLDHFRSFATISVEISPSPANSLSLGPASLRKSETATFGYLIHYVSKTGTYCFQRRWFLVICPD